MAALSANTAKVAGGTILARPGPKTIPIKNAVTPYQGSLMVHEHATGTVRPVTSANDGSFAGVSLISATGTATYATSPTDSLMTQDIYVSGASVTGLTAATKCPQPIYFGTDDNTLTLTRPTANPGIPVGMALTYTSSGVGDILLFGQMGSSILGLAGSDRRRIAIWSGTFATFTNSWLINWTLYGHGLITAIGVQPSIIASTAGKTTLLTGNLTVPGGALTAITGGALTLTTVGLGTVGTDQSVSPTAANEFYDGTTFNLTASATTAFIEGSGTLWIEVQSLP